jgi:tRNA(Ser,Leu) C12 N-acetylase TAN1
MDPITTSVAVVLGKYALDKGVELGKEVGPKALETAKEMVGTVLARIRREPDGEFVARNYEQSPEVYQKPMEQALDAEVKTDPSFAEQLQALLSQYDEASKEFAVETGRTYQATVTGSGAAAVGDGAVAAGEGGIAVGGSVEGGISIGAQKPDEDKR